jgi:hypothetical protein
MALAASAIAVLMIVAAAEAQGQTLQVLPTFTSGDNGGNPVVGLTMDRAGNLYGTTSAGESFACQVGCGVVFEVMP